VRYREPVDGSRRPELSLALLGPPVVRRDGRSVTFDTRKAIALLALLAVTGREHSREQLAGLLWPEADGAKGRASLRRTLSVTAAMGAGLSISRAAVTLEPALGVDVREFETLLARPDAASLERAVQLYRDEFLSGFAWRGCPDFEGWQAWVAEGCGGRWGARCSGWWRPASLGATWSARPGTPGAGCSSIRCASPPIRPLSGDLDTGGVVGRRRSGEPAPRRCDNHVVRCASL
jgi:hypothetical protein